jgi:N-acetyl-anhydromuramyl-L-alanine amidase AmpD
LSIRAASSFFFSLLLLGVVAPVVSPQAAQARKHSLTASTTSSSSSHRSRHQSAEASTSRSGHHHAVAHVIGGVKNAALMATGHRRRHHGKEVTARVAPKTRYAYSASLFMPKPPDFEQTPLSPALAEQVQRAFEQGTADTYPARMLVRAGIIHYHPLHGGIFWRREPVKYIIMHSTEPGIDQSAPRIIESWSSMGIRHPGAQYVVGRDGGIYQAVDPELATVHINIFKTLPGINNDNSIGIEMCHYGHQDYPAAQRESVAKLVTYLQERYKVPDENVITHRYAQQGDHTDPVYFDWDGFTNDKRQLRTRAIAIRVNKINEEARNLPDMETATTAAAATTFLLQPHSTIKATSTATTTVKTDSGKRVTETRTVTTTIQAAPTSPPAANRDVLRGPIEVEPGMVQQLSAPGRNAAAPHTVAPAVPPVKTPMHAQTAPPETEAQPHLLAEPKDSSPQTGAPIPTGAPANSEMDNMVPGTDSMDPDGKGADAKPSPAGSEMDAK